MKKANSHQEHDESVQREMHIAWQRTLERYASEIAAIQAESESIFVNLGSHIDTQHVHLNARMQELLNAINSQLQASTPVQEITSLSDSWTASRTQQFMAIDRNRQTDLAQPAIPLAGLAAEPFARTDFGVRTQTHPGDEMGDA